MIPLTYEELESTISHWAVTHPDLFAGVVVGSRGCLDHPDDQWSDLDLIIFCTATEVFIQDGSWLESFNPL